jgi:CheY-like chemotaxis protein/nitrogen-specific signal transduction histidine kinase/HPt (histidine-containing phosphotransfer) domain-containing protein
VGFRIDITDLMNANEAARSASEAKSQFLANMSHEIRTPLNAILGMLRLLQRTPLSPRQFDYTGKTESAARALLALVNDILDFSKIEAGMMLLDPQPFRPRQLLDDLNVLLTAQQRDERAVALHIDADPALPEWLQGDAMRLLQVLVNLGGNALKFTQQGEVRVRVAVLSQDDGAVRLDFAVSDTGIGIAPEHIGRIFTGFSQAEASTTRRYGGTGLGLAISRRFVQLMGGDLQVDSVAGQGSRFHFQVSLPLAQPPADQAGGARAPGEPAPATDDPVLRTHSAQRLRGLRVLLVEDNPNNRQVASELLQDEGADVRSAHDGREGADLVLADPQQFDVVLMDVQMPVMDGLDATRLIRADARCASLPIVAMSANVSTADRAEALAAGMNDHVGKPFELNHLAQVLQRWTGWQTSDPAQAALPTLVLPPALAADAQASGMALQEALDRVLGRTAVYQRMLGLFAERRAEVQELLAGHLARRDTEALGRELHSLKGMAAMLGARDLAALAAQGEAGAATLDEVGLQALCRRFDDSVQHLQRLAAQLPAATTATRPEATPPWPPAQPAVLQALLARLGAQLAEADMAATDTFEELQAHCEGAPTDLMAPLEAAIGRLDFAAAQAHTQALQDLVEP